MSLFPQQTKKLKVNSYLFFYFEQLLYSHLLVLRNPSGSIDTPETPSTAVLKKLQVIKSNLHKWSTGRRHLIMTKYTTAKSVKRKAVINTHSTDLWTFLPMFRHPKTRTCCNKHTAVKSTEHKRKKSRSSQPSRLCKCLHYLHKLLGTAGRQKGLKILCSYAEVSRAPWKELCETQARHHAPQHRARWRTGNVLSNPSLHRSSGMRSTRSCLLWSICTTHSTLRQAARRTAAHTGRALPAR